jgi:hypothetical protein
MFNHKIETSEAITLDDFTLDDLMFATKESRQTDPQFAAHPAAGFSGFLATLAYV